MNTGTLVEGIVGSGGKTKFDGDSSPAKEFTLDGRKVKNGVLPANTVISGHCLTINGIEKF